VQHEWIHIGTQFGDDERSLVHHQAADEVHIAAQAVELRYDHGSLVLLGQLHRCGQLRPLFQRIGAFAGLDLAEDLDQIVALGLGEGGNRRLLGVEADAGLALRSGRYANRGPPRVKGRPKSSSAASSRSSSQAYLDGSIPAGFSG
jgi:hypothetical protein